MRRSPLLTGLVLLMLRAAAWTQSGIPVYFNHVTLTVPAATYETLGRDPFLSNELGALKTVSIETGHGQQTSLILFGEKTYIEFLAEDATHPAGHIEFTLSIADAKQLVAVRRQLKNKAALAHETRQFGGREIPWYDSLTGDWVPHSPFTFSVVAYDPEYLPTIYPNEPRGMKEVSRQQYLASQYQPGRLFHDVKRIAISARETDIRSMLALLQAFGYASIVSGDTDIARGPELEFVFMATKGNQPESIELDLGLNRAREGLVREKFEDGSELVVLSNLARWSFPAAIRDKK